VTAFASAIRVQYPGCPANEAIEIPEHACRKSSGHVGRTAAAKVWQRQGSEIWPDPDLVV
jgi:hypothetical protein